jgi:mRNA-degrading endonuclease toxin of MazEF toxin-antitoxin module
MNPTPSESGAVDPRRGEVWIVDFDPSLGSEQRKRRPAAVLSVSFVGRLPLRIVVPITFTRWPDALWLVPIKANKANGLTNDFSADASQVKSLDGERFVRRIGVLTADEMEEIVAAVAVCIGFTPGPRGAVPRECSKPRFPWRRSLRQGTFRLAVTSAYSRSFTVTGEQSLPALEAAHIRPFGDGGEHEVGNGLLLRSDIRRLFDTGYVGVTPDYKFVVSCYLRGDYSNGRSYYPLHGQPIALPAKREEWPCAAEALAWHGESVLKW